MEILLPLLFSLGCLFLAVNNLRAMRHERRDRDTGADWAARHKLALAVSPADFGEAAGADGPLGVVMEVGAPAMTLTLTAFADGRASLFSSAGGGVIEDSGRQAVREAVLAFLAEADRRRPVLRRVSHCPRPGAGNVRFNVIGAGGVIAGEEDEEALDRGWSPLSALYDAGVKTMQALRQQEA